MKKLLLGSAIIAGTSASFAFFGLNSGLNVGESVTPFHPYHVSGPLAGTANCFPCTFQNRPQVQVWVNGDDHKNINEIAKTLDSAMSKYSKSEFKALIVFVTDASHVNDWKAKVAAAVKQSGYKTVGMAVLSKDDGAVKAYKVNTDASVKNTVFVYKNWKVAAKTINLSGDKGVAWLNTQIASIAK